MDGIDTARLHPLPSHSTARVLLDKKLLDYSNVELLER